MSTIVIDPDTPLAIGDLIEAGSVMGTKHECIVVGVVNDNIYEIRTEGGDKTEFIRRARHKEGVKNGIFVYVKRNARGQWVRTETGPAYYWAAHPKRQIGQQK